MLVDVMSHGLGVQSTTVMTLAGAGLIPMPTHWVFADPQFESEETYAHRDRCQEYLAKYGRKIDVVSAGNIEREAVEFAQRRANSDVKRYASLPIFVTNLDGSEGRMPRQCTTEFKIEPIEEYHRRVVMELKPRQHAPKVPTVNVWIGISSDEERRASAPGRWREVDVEVGKDLLDEPVVRKIKRWEPTLWQVKTYPLLGRALYPDRRSIRDERFDHCAGWDRDDCKNWLEKAWPYPVPRSACICCPYRTNQEWREMRDLRPEEFARAAEFDRAVREGYRDGDMARRGRMLGEVFLHRSRVPLAMADLDADLNDRMGCGGLFSQEPDGLCGT